MPGASHRSYVVIEILVESAALYSVSLLIYILVFTLASEASFNTYSEYMQPFVMHMAVSIQCSCTLKETLFVDRKLSQSFAPALIMLRVALGRTRPDTAWSGPGDGQITGLSFDSRHSDHDETRIVMSQSQNDMASERPPQQRTINPSTRESREDLEVGGE
jgi:hypothetical protein